MGGALPFSYDVYAYINEASTGNNPGPVPGTKVPGVKPVKPDNITVAFYSPYHGTEMAEKGYDNNMFDTFQPNVDSQLRSTSKDSLISVDKLNYYKKNFLDFVYD